LGGADVDWGYHRDYAHFNWRGWVPFGTGALGDMGAHLMDFPVWALELGLPTRVETKHTLWGGDDDPWDYKRPETLTSYPLSAVTYYEFGKAKGGPVKLTWMDGGLAPPTIRGCRWIASWKRKAAWFSSATRGCCCMTPMARSPR
jgi:hypothetical protein